MSLLGALTRIGRKGWKAAGNVNAGRAAGIALTGAAGAGVTYVGGRAVGSALGNVGSGIGQFTASTGEGIGEGVAGVGEGTGQAIKLLLTNSGEGTKSALDSILMPALIIGGGVLLYKAVSS